MAYPGLRVLVTECPMRAWRDPQVQDWMMLWSRCAAWQVLPRAGGVEDQDALDMAALEVIEDVMDWPMMPERT